ncbi:MAG TPA: hypothetical protein VGN12_24130 [Pirellulales bacterium]
MREELLTHLTSIYEDELATHKGDQALALTAAAERFGESNALHAELQATVPHVERVLCTPLHPSNHRLARRPGETVPSFLHRLGPWGAGINAVAWILFALFIFAVSRSRPHRAPEASATLFFVFCAANVVLYPFFYILPTLLSDAVSRHWQMTENMNSRVRRRIIAKFVAIVVIRLTWAVPCLLLLRHIGVFPFTSTPWFYGIAAGWALINAVAAAAGVAELSRWSRWDGLVLDDHAAPDETVAGA